MTLNFEFDNEGITLMSTTLPLRPICRYGESVWIIHDGQNTQALNKDAWDIAFWDEGWIFTTKDGKMAVKIERRNIECIADVDFEGDCGKLEWLQ